MFFINIWTYCLKQGFSIRNDISSYVFNGALFLTLFLSGLMLPVKYAKAQDDCSCQGCDLFGSRVHYFSVWLTQDDSASMIRIATLLERNELIWTQDKKIPGHPDHQSICEVNAGIIRYYQSLIGKDSVRANPEYGNHCKEIICYRKRPVRSFKNKLFERVRADSGIGEIYVLCSFRGQSQYIADQLSYRFKNGIQSSEKTQFIKEIQQNDTLSVKQRIDVSNLSFRKVCITLTQLKKRQGSRLDSISLNCSSCFVNWP